jgi:hypothetical protein
MVKGYLDEILGPKHVSYELIQVDDSPLIGAAVAGLMCLEFDSGIVLW